MYEIVYALFWICLGAVGGWLYSRNKVAYEDLCGVHCTEGVDHEMEDQHQTEFEAPDDSMIVDKVWLDGREMTRVAYANSETGVVKRWTDDYELETLKGTVKVEMLDKKNQGVIEKTP